MRWQLSYCAKSSIWFTVIFNRFYSSLICANFCPSNHSKLNKAWWCISCVSELCYHWFRQQLGHKPLHQPMLIFVTLTLWNELRNFNQNITKFCPGNPWLFCRLYNVCHYIQALINQQHIDSLRPSEAYICISKLTNIGSDNGLSPGRHQAIILTNAGILLIEPLGTKFEIYTFSFKKMHLKMAKWRPFCLGLNVLTNEWEKTLCLLSLAEVCCLRCRITKRNICEWLTLCICVTWQRSCCSCVVRASSLCWRSACNHRHKIIGHVTPGGHYWDYYPIVLSVS